MNLPAARVCRGCGVFGPWAAGGQDEKQRRGLESAGDRRFPSKKADGGKKKKKKAPAAPPAAGASFMKIPKHAHVGKKTAGKRGGAEPAISSCEGKRRRRTTKGGGKNGLPFCTFFLDAGPMWRSGVERKGSEKKKRATHGGKNPARSFSSSTPALIAAAWQKKGFLPAASAPSFPAACPGGDRGRDGKKGGEAPPPSLLFRRARANQALMGLS